MEINNQSILPAQKLKTKNQIISLKIILTIIISNIFVYLITAQDSGTSVSIKNEILKDHIRLEISLKLFVNISSNKDRYPISILTNRQNVVIKKAYLINSQKINDIKQFEGPGHNIQTIIVEIHKKDITILLKYINQKLSAYPYLESFLTNSKKEKTNYELIF